MSSSDPAGHHLPARKAKPFAPEPSAQAAHASQRALISSMLSPFAASAWHGVCKGNWHVSVPLAFVH